MNGNGEPGSAEEALGVIEAALDFLNGPGLDGAVPAELGGRLRALARIGGKYSAAFNAHLSRFDANGCHDEDGHQTSASWLAGKTQTPLPAARGKVKAMRQVTGRRLLDEAMRDGVLSGDWAAQIIKWSKPLPEELHEDLDKVLLAAIDAGATLEDLWLLVVKAIEAWKATRPDPDEDNDGDNFDDRRVTLNHTFEGAGKFNGDLTPECAAAWQAVLDALGKKQGPEDSRTKGQRFHDAMQEAAELLLRAKLVPDRAGGDTRIDGVISLGQLLDMEGASAVEDAWLAAGSDAGHHVYLTGTAADAISCDALITPVVTGGADWSVVGQMIELLLDALDGHAPARRDGVGPVPGMPPVPDAVPLPPEAWHAILLAIAKLSIGFVAGPGNLASALRMNLLPAPWNSRSVPIDIGYSESIPESIRRAVRLRDRKCAWPGGCNARPAICDVHHVKHKKNGGKTSVDSCILLCQYHHDICIHRWGWDIDLLPNGDVIAYGPLGQILRSHSPPAAAA